MKTETNPAVGIALALTTAVVWGTLPIAMKQLLSAMNPQTIICYRFIISSVILFFILQIKHQLPPIQKLKHKRWIILFIIGTLGLVGNFVLFVTALKYLSPPVLQVIVQLSTIGLMIASIWIFKESIRVSQLVGIIVLVMGLVLFFNKNLVELFTQFTDYSFGVLVAFCAAISWIFYGIMQKVLLRKFKSQQILLVMYILCVIFLLPFSDLGSLLTLNGIQLALLFYCGINTIIGYGALAEAMNRWQISKVSAVVTLTPLFTLLFSDLLALLYPNYFIYPPINIVGYIGAFAVVAGAMIAATGHRLAIFKRKQPSITSKNP